MEAEPILDSVLDHIGRTPLVALSRLFPEHDVEVLAKMELLNPGGSMKDRSAQHIIGNGLADGSIRPGDRLVESSSGNFGVAIAMVARIHGLHFTCVVDPMASAANLAIMESLGADVERVTEPAEVGGYLGARLARVREIVNSTGAVWINQYANDRNWLAHYHGTGAELAEDLVCPPTVLVAPVSTTGSILGCARRLREHAPQMRVVAVDAVGSVIFSGDRPSPPGTRELPGAGAGRVPELHSPEEIDDVVHIDDATAAEACRDLLLEEAIFAGGSTGSVVAAVRRILPSLPRPARVVCLFPDRGDRYLDRVYDDAWLERARVRAGRGATGPQRRVVGGTA
ncbi:2,3-diaminopropionate biosynthesis protein SbnA [Pseudonocardia sp. EC080610-09]|uniref:2,3-diaminopropionate biosynthesis protein SbnA n=1 Tax=Pseudonocardia sp. EC080610-09 TaxID=1688404 RepID=UPI0007620165|nr:2,3-diaminopropionate biosynthesis protein SbnA [Pseudonocardia sp. EC080610-09]